MLRLVSLAFACCWMAIPASAQDANKLVDNPEYTNWAAFKPGTSVTYKQSVDGAAKVETTIIMRLSEVQADKLVIEAETTLKLMGNEVKQAPIKREVAKKVEAAVAAQVNDPPGKVSDGIEKVTVAGQNYEAKWFKTETKQGESTTRSTVYFTDKIPGRLVRMEAKTEGPGASTVTMEVVDLTIK